MTVTEGGREEGYRDHGAVQDAHEKEREVVEGLYSFSFSCIEG